MSETESEVMTFRDVCVRDITAVLEDSKGRLGHVGWEVRNDWSRGVVFDKDEWQMELTFTKKKPIAPGDMVVGTPGWRPNEPTEVIHVHGDLAWVAGEEGRESGFIARKERLQHAQPEASE